MLTARVADLSVDEFRVLIRQIVRETLAEMLSDPDEGLELTDEIKVALRRSLKSVREGEAIYDAEDVASRLGLEG